MKHSFLVLRVKFIALCFFITALFSMSANADSSGVIKTGFTAALDSKQCNHK